MQSHIDIKGYYDFHVHAGPDVKPRKITYLELIPTAVQAGMGGLVIKNHFFPTSCEAALLQIQFPEIKIFGGVTLNYSVGGLNVDAAEKNIEMGGKVVWLPTHDAMHERKFQNQEGGIEILNQGKLKKEVLDLADLTASKNIVLATGHLSYGEIIKLLEYTASIKHPKVIINHPGIIFQRFTIAQQNEMVKYGALLEYSFCRPPHTLTQEEFCFQIKEIGPENLIIGTDLGQPANPHPVDGMKDTIQLLLNNGFSGNDVKKMICGNPKYLLDA